MIDQREVLQNLISQRNDLQQKIADLQNNLEQGRSQYLKLTGAIDVLQQLLAANRVESEAPEVVEEVPEVVEEPTEE